MLLRYSERENLYHLCLTIIDFAVKAIVIPKVLLAGGEYGLMHLSVNVSILPLKRSCFTFESRRLVFLSQH